MLHWLAFMRGQSSLGVAIVDANNPDLALDKATLLGINPGGEVCIIPMPDGSCVPPSSELPQNVLITPAQLDAVGLIPTSKMNEDQKRVALGTLQRLGAQKVCEDCNTQQPWNSLN